MNSYEPEGTDLTIDYSYRKGFPETQTTPPEPPDVEIHGVYAGENDLSEWLSEHSFNWAKLQEEVLQYHEDEEV